MRNLLGAIALAALVTAAVQADPGGGKGNGGAKNNGGGAEAHGQSGKQADRGQAMATRETAREDRGNGKASGGNPGQREASNHQAKGHGFETAKAARASDHRVLPGSAQPNGRNAIATERHAAWQEYDRRGLINGCPPGLAKKNNGCLPPGLAKQSGYDQYDANWWGLRGLNNLSGYRYVDGNLVRLTPGGAVMDYYPLLGGGLAIGNQWPSSWQPTPLSPYYANYYGLGNDYRYFDGAIYRVDPSTSVIQSVAALLTGDNFTVGQRLPSGYDAYNVPGQYRDQYADRADANYRYSDGYVYQTDPTTQLIVAAIKLLT